MADNQATPQQKPMPADPDSAPVENDVPEAAARGEEPVKEVAVAEKPRKGSWARPLLRILVAMIILFLLGALAVFFWLFRPADEQLQALRVQATQTAGQLQQRDRELRQAQDELESARGDVESSKNTLEVELSRNNVLRAINDLTFARMALQAEDKEGVIEALTNSEERLVDVLPLVQERDPEQASTLTALYTLAKNDLERDLELAGQDLDRLQTELERVEDNVLTRD